MFSYQNTKQKQHVFCSKTFIQKWLNFQEFVKLRFLGAVVPFVPKFLRALVPNVSLAQVLLFPPCLIPDVSHSLSVLVPDVLSCLTCLVPYVPNYLVLYVLPCLMCLAPYMLLCSVCSMLCLSHRCLVPNVLSCFTYHFVFLFGLSFTDIHNSQDGRGSGRLSL